MVIKLLKDTKKVTISLDLSHSVNILTHCQILHSIYTVIIIFI